MLDDSSPSVLSRKATQDSKLDEAGGGEELELVLADPELEDPELEDPELEDPELEDPELASGAAEELVELEEDDPAELDEDGGGDGCGNGSGEAWNPGGGMVRT